MAKDGLFFHKAGELNRFDVPAYGLWIQVIWASLLCLSGKVWRPAGDGDLRGARVLRDHHPGHLHPPQNPA